jgi:hypothetical protein
MRRISGCFADVGRSLVVRKLLLLVVVGALLTVHDSHPQGQATGLVAAFGFDEISGTTVADASGLGQTGTVSGATRTAAGRYGGALSFDGVDDWVTIPDSVALDLTTGMTIEAWVFPRSSSGWRTAMLKETADGLAYGLYAHNGAAGPAGYINTGGSDQGAAAAASLPLNSWTHVATTYDGATLRLFVNGTQVASRAVAGSLRTSTSPLRIGGNAVWGEYFSGMLDEVRIYNRALSTSEIQADMTTPIGAAPDFSFAAYPSPKTIEPDGATFYEAEVTFLNGFTSYEVVFWVTGLPAGVTGEYAPNPIPHQGRTALNLTASNAPTGTYTLTMGATAEGITHSQNVTLIVSSTPDFSMSVEPITNNVAAGGAGADYQVTLGSINNFANPVSLSVSGLPSGVSASFTPAAATPPATSVLTITAGSSTVPGQYSLTVTGTSGSTVRSTAATLIVTTSSSNTVWTVAPMGSTGVHNNTVRVGPVRNDGVERVYIGTIPTGRVLEYSWNGSAWSAPLNVGGSPAGLEIHNMEIGTGRNDGVTRIYACSLDRNVYEISYSAGTWTQTVVGTLNSEAMHAVVGAGRNDGVNRVYSVSTSNLYESTWNGSGWTTTLVGGIPGAHGITIGVGRNNALNSLYIGSISSGTYEARYVSGAWTISPMGDSGDVRNVGLGVGRRDGIVRVYSALYNGQVRELSWNGSGWTAALLGPSIGSPLIHAYVLPGRNDGVNRVYTSGGTGNAYEYTWNGSSWTMYNMGGGTDYLYGFHYGVGRNDGLLRLYGADRGTINQVYEYSWSGSAPPDGTPPVISTLAASAVTAANATITWTTNEPSDSRVDYGTDAAALTLSQSSPARVTGHSVTLSGLTSGTTYYYRARSTDAAGNASTSPGLSEPPLSFTTLPPALSIGDVSVAEGNAGSANAVFTVTLSPASSATVTASYVTSDGTATGGSDYVSGAGTITFNPGTTSQSIAVAVNGDTVLEPHETFFVDLGNPTNAAIARPQAVGTILNDESVPAISITDVSVTEGNAGTVNAVFTVNLSASTGQTVSVGYATANGTAVAGADYAAASGSLTFAPGTTSQTVNVSVLGDAVDEPNETFVVNLSSAVNATLADSQGAG